MPDYKQYRQVLTSLNVPKDQVDPYLEALKSYYDAYENFTRKDVRNLPYVMKPEDYDLLFALYKDVLKATDNLYDSFRAGGILSQTQPPDFLKEHEFFFGHNYRLMKVLAARKEPVPLLLASHHEKNLVYYGDEATGSVLGGNASKRTVIKVRGSDGRVRLGVFTPEVTVTERSINNPKTFQEKFNNHYLELIPGERVDSRNSAMTDVAELLGRKDLLASAEDIRIERDGKVISGNFMEFVEGTDINRISRNVDDPIRYVDPLDYHTDRLKADVLDLTVIDYLCLNKDRHAANLIYSYQTDASGKVRVNGVRGIDNDGSFGTRNPDPAMPSNRLASLDNTVVITETMAEKLLSVTPDVLRGTLRSYQICGKAINNAVKRLDLLKTRIRNGRALSDRLKKDQLTADDRDLLHDPLQYVEDNGLKDVMIAVPEKHLSALNVDSIARRTNYYIQGNLHHCGIFSMVKGTHQPREIRRNMYINDTLGTSAPLHIPSEIAVPLVQDTRGLSRSYGPRLLLFQETLARIRPLDKREDSPLDPIMDTLEQMKSLTDTMGQEDHVPTDMEMNLFNNLTSELKAQCSRHLEDLKTLPNKRSLRDFRDQSRRFAESMEVLSGQFRDEFRNLRENDLLELNFRASRQADVLRRLGPELLDAGSSIREAAAKEPIDREALTLRAANVLYLQALSELVMKKDPDNIELMLDPEIREQNLKKLLPTVREYFADMEFRDEQFRRMTEDPHYEKDLLAGFRLFRELSAGPKKAGNAPSAPAPKSREEQAEATYSALGLG